MAWSAQTTGFSCSSILEVLRPCSALGAKAGSCSVCFCFLCFFFLYSSCDLDLARVIQNHFLLKGKKKKKSKVSQTILRSKPEENCIIYILKMGLLLFYEIFWKKPSSSPLQITLLKQSHFKVKKRVENKTMYRLCRDVLQLKRYICV